MTSYGVGGMLADLGDPKNMVLAIEILLLRALEPEIYAFPVWAAAILFPVSDDVIRC